MDSSLGKTLLGLAALLLVPGVRGQGGPVLRVQTVGGQRTFRVGERIPLELSFTASEEKRYEISLARYDRSGRMRDEEFTVSPAGGWVDPLERFFAGGFMGGGLSGLGELSARPTEMKMDLNEWVRFDQPGSYTVTVSSRRVSDAKNAKRFGERQVVTANPFQVQIVAATKEWQAKKLAAILGELCAEPVTIDKAVSLGSMPASRNLDVGMGHPNCGSSAATRVGMPSPERVAAMADLR